MTHSVPGTVFLVDDDPDARAQLSYHLMKAGFSVQAFEGAAHFLASVGPLDAGCLVLDLQLGGDTGLDLLTLLADRHEERPVVMISGEAEVPSVVQAVQGGVVDFLVKPVDPATLCSRVAHCLALDEQRRANVAAERDLRRRYNKLTPREREVMPLLVEGKTVKRIAADLGISPKTADVHRGRILQKMDCDSVVDLVHAVRDLKLD
ncbi:response regulator transcription factor [Alienimonas chondri]|uniref:response regulator transcription factor n=1 Tax=Alienimonas chondri TaxID=2681879 RepID=UPI001487EFF5|nr:response regulator [Alienimonas chondri]